MEQLEEVYSVIPGLIEIKNRLYTDVAALLRQEVDSKERK